MPCVAPASLAVISVKSGTHFPPQAYACALGVWGMGRGRSKEGIAHIHTTHSLQAARVRQRGTHLPPRGPGPPWRHPACSGRGCWRRDAAVSALQALSVPWGVCWWQTLVLLHLGGPSHTPGRTPQLQHAAPGGGWRGGGVVGGVYKRGERGWEAMQARGMCVCVCRRGGCGRDGEERDGREGALERGVGARGGWKGGGGSKAYKHTHSTHQAS